MTVLLLVIIYFTFISLGLPDSLLGVSWPIMHLEFAADEGLAGVFNAVISVCTIFSSLMAFKLTAKFGVGKVVAFSVLLTAVGILSAVFINNAYLYFVVAIPMGLGAGAIDCILNGYVARNYKAIHMSWLHCCWGVGAMIGSLSIGAFVDRGYSWRYGYLTVGIVQAVLTIMLFSTLKIWKKVPDNTINVIDDGTGNKAKKSSNLTLIKTRGVPFCLIAFIFYCSMEVIVSLWCSSYFVNIGKLSPADAAKKVSLYYVGMIVGRFLNGILSLKIKDMFLVRGGLTIAAAGMVLLFFPGSATTTASMLLIGLGFAPTYPTMMHLTPSRFGEKAEFIVGLQTSSTYISFLLSPILFGYLATKISFTLLPYFLIGLVALTFLSNEISQYLTVKSAVKE